MSLGEPREHLPTVGSTNERARELAEDGAAHGTLVTADEQTAGRGRQGRGWVTPPGVAIAASLILREFDDLLPLRAGLAVADVAGPDALVKWPNDVWIDGRKVAGILVEARGNEWAILGIGVNVAVDRRRCRPTPRRSRGRSACDPTMIEPTLAELLTRLERRLGEDRAAVARRRCASATRCSGSPCAGRTARASAPASMTPAPCSSNCRTGPRPR